MTEVDIPAPPAVAEETPPIPDFFGGVEETHKWYFPGQDETDPSAQYIEFSIMDEGMRKKWQRKTSKDIKVNRKDQSAQIGIDPAGDREQLFEAVVVDWYIIDRKKNQPVPFTLATFRNWQNRQDPRLIDKLELAIRESNPWMQDEMDPESIREEIDRLERLYDEAVKRRDEKSEA